MDDTTIITDDQITLGTDFRPLPDASSFRPGEDLVPGEFEPNLDLLCEISRRSPAMSLGRQGLTPGHKDR